MKHRLIKELPGAKIGNFVSVDKNLITVYQLNDGNWCIINISIPKLKDLGWIEESKPRELYVEFFKDTDKISDSSFDLTYLRNDARFYTKRFIEVIE